MGSYQHKSLVPVSYQECCYVLLIAVDIIAYCETLLQVQGLPVRAQYHSINRCLQLTFLETQTRQFC